MKVMKIINLIIGIACLLGACHSNRMRIEGEIGDIKENKIYLGNNEYLLWVVRSDRFG